MLDIRLVEYVTRRRESKTTIKAFCMALCMHENRFQSCALGCAYGSLQEVRADTRAAAR